MKNPKINCTCKKIIYTVGPEVLMYDKTLMLQRCDKGHVCGIWKIPNQVWATLLKDANNGG